MTFHLVIRNINFGDILLPSTTTMLIYLYFCHIYIYNVPAWSFYYVFHVNSFLTAVSFCQSTHFLAYHIDFIFMSPVRIDDPRPSIILIKSICHIIVQHSSKSVLILHLKLRLVSKLASFIWNPSRINRVFKARK